MPVPNPVSIERLGSEEGRYCQGSHATEFKGQKLPTFLMWLEVPPQKWVEIEEKKLQKTKNIQKKNKLKIKIFMNSRNKTTFTIQVTASGVHVYVAAPDRNLIP